MLNSVLAGQFQVADMEEGAAPAPAPAAPVHDLGVDVRQAPNPESNRSKKKANQAALKAEKDAFAAMLYETNHLTSKGLHEQFSEFDFTSVMMNTNADSFMDTYALTNSHIIKIWNRHSNRGNVANCMCCGVRKVSVPNIISRMTGNRHFNDKKNHPHNAASFLPNAFLVFNSTEQKAAIDGMMTEIRSREGTIEEARGVWTGIKAEHNVNVSEIISVVCYHCYNFNLMGNCLDAVAAEDNSQITPEKYIESTYNYLVPFLIAKNRCIHNEDGRFCCNKVLSRDSLTHCKPENLERVTHLIDGKEEIIRQRMIGYTEHMELFVCNRHRVAFGCAPHE